MHEGNVFTDGNKVELRLPIVKVDKERRIVSGFATLDNVDRQDDRVLAEASKRAFSKWRGNIREMHNNIAVGKAVSITDKPYVDDDGKVYNGVYVDAYISTGAQPTWEKVLDGTLTGFSIGGQATKVDSSFDKAAGKQVRVVSDYDLIELSLVDSPANQLANIMSIQKADNGRGGDITGIAAETETLNVFYNADSDEFMLTKSEDSLNSKFEMLGWVEDNDDKYTQIRKLFEGGNTMADETKAAVVSEVETATEPATVQELFKSFKTEVLEALSGSNSELQKSVDGNQTSLEDLTAKLSDFGAKQEEFVTKQGELEKTLTGLDERLTAIEESGAVKKSQEVVETESEQEEEDPSLDKVWKGQIFSSSQIFKV